VGEFGYALPTSKNNMSIRHICQLEFVRRPPIRIYMPLQVIVTSQGQAIELAKLQDLSNRMLFHSPETYDIRSN
jgi:hypothetical protein